MHRFAWFTLLAILPLAAACFGGGSKSGPATTAQPDRPGPLTTATATVGYPCPVDQDVCDFADELESAARDESLVRWLPTKDKPELAARARDMWAVTGQLPRVVTVGCTSTGANSSDCSKRFAIALSSLPEGLEEQDGRGLVVLRFERDEGGAPFATETTAPSGERSKLVQGGSRTFCGPPTAPGDCVEYNFERYRTGVPEADPPAPGQLPPLRQVSGATSKVITEGAPYAIKPGELWYFTNLCDACGPGPFPNLFRAYLDAAGTLVIDDLKARTLALGTPAAFTADWKQGIGYLVTCGPGVACYNLETGGSGTGEATVYRTTDGGITWREHGTVPFGTALDGIVGDQVLARTWTASTTRNWLYPSGRDLDRPPNLPVSPDGHVPYPFAVNQTTAWMAQDGAMYDQAGAPLFAPLFAEKYRIQIAATDIQYQHTYLTWEERPGTPTTYEQAPFYSYVGHIDRDGQLRDIYGLPGDTIWIGGEFQRDGGAPPALYGRFRFGDSQDYVRDVSWGAVLDLRTAELHRLTQLEGGLRPGQFVWVQDLVEVRAPETAAPNAWRRVSGTGSCLNVRSEPSLSAPVRACLADDVLVADTGERVTTDGIDWVHIGTRWAPGGWVSAEFLR